MIGSKKKVGYFSTGKGWLSTFSREFARVGFHADAGGRLRDETGCERGGVGGVEIGVARRRSARAGKMGD